MLEDEALVYSAVLGSTGGFESWRRSGTPSATGANTLTDATKNWVPNGKWVGGAVNIYTAQWGSSISREATASTANQVTVGANWGVAQLQKYLILMADTFLFAAGESGDGSTDLGP